MKRREMVTLMGSAGLLGLPALIHTGYESKIIEPGAMKTIGILGGLGPQATMDMEIRLHRAAQQLLPQAQNSGYPPIVVQYYRHAPVLLTKENIPVAPWQADPRMLAVAKTLGSMADFIIIPSNGAHLFQQEIEKAAGKKVLSMIDITLQEATGKNWKKIGVLGLMNPKVYTHRLAAMGIACETIGEALQAKLNQAIMKVMEGREDEGDRAIALQSVNYLREQHCDGIIPGCTEIPLLLGKQMEAGDLLNPAELLAGAAIRFAIG